MNADSLLSVLVWTRKNLLDEICRARKFDYRDERYTLERTLINLDSSLRSLAAEARAVVIRESARVYRAGVWFSTVVAAAVPVGREHGVAEYKFAGWVFSRLRMPDAGRSVTVRPVVGEDLVEGFRETLKVQR